MNQESQGYLLNRDVLSFLGIELRGKVIMVKSKTKREKKEETVEEFVARINKSAVRTNGLKKNLKGARR
jgi:FMN-dependent NADH-azoreductase